MPAADPAGDRDDRRRRRAVLALVVVVLIILLLLGLLRGCRPAGVERGFDYIQAKASKLDLDAARLLAYVRDLPTLEYRGDVKGPLATLWNGAGSPEEKAALASALLAACGQPRAVSPAEVAPAPAPDDGGLPTTPFQLTLVHRALSPDGAAPVETEVWRGPIAALVGDVHTIELPAAGTTRFTLRAGANTIRDVAVASTSTGEELELRIERPGSSEPARVLRELWHQGDRVGPDRAVVGDRHDLVVLPCRVSAYVREKEALLLAQRGRKTAPEAEPYLALLDWARESDASLLKLEERHAVRAQFDLPRVLILSRFVAPGLPGGFADALDLRQDRVGLRGATPAAAFQATQVRSFVEAGLEHQFLARRSRLPVTSTFDVFTRLRDDVPCSPASRLRAIGQALVELRTAAGLDGEVVFAAADARRTRAAAVQVKVTRTAGGTLRVRGGPALPAFATALASAPGAPRIPYAADGSLDATFETDEEAALAVEATLLAANVTPPVEPTYLLATTLARGTEPLVEPGATFELAWGEGEGRSEQRIRVLECGHDLALRFRVQGDGLPVAGTRTIEAAALEAALVHNPWYRAGASRQAGSTSFCVSRKVHAALAAGTTVDLGLQGKLGPDDDERAPRKVERTVQLAPLGKTTVEVLVNGRRERLPALRAKLGDAELVVLDDPTWAVGALDRVRSISTCVRGRLVDLAGVAIAGAQVSLRGSRVPPVTTAVDGSFRLPPAPGGSYGKVELAVSGGGVKGPARDASEVAVQVDLTSPGLSVVEVAAPRPRTELRYLTRATAGDLDALPLSDQVKRHARRDLEAGLLVTIPSRMVDDGVDEAIGYFACDRATGDLAAVTEAGWNGATEWSRAVESAAKDVANAVKDADLKGVSSGPVHMLRGAIVAYWVYCGARLEGHAHKEAIVATLSAMDGWADALQLTNLGGQVGLGEDHSKAALEKALSGLVGQGLVGTDDDAAKAAFKLGYMGATLFLASRLEDSDG